MAALQERNGRCRVIFNDQGTQRAFTLGRVAETDAKAKVSQVDYLLIRLKQGLIDVPSGGDIVASFRHDGTLPTTAPSPSASRPEPTLAEIRDRYLETHANGTLELHTVRGIRRHFGHLARHLGDGFPIRKLTLADLQSYANKVVLDVARIDLSTISGPECDAHVEFER
jgi:hypothetical protein